jgi:kynurenine formamidase
MGRNVNGEWVAEGWSPPTYTVDANGKIVDFVNDRQPNNWGRWGDLDELGTVNFITPEIIRDAARLIKSGRAFSLAVPLDRGGPVHPGRLAGVVHLWAFSGGDQIVGGDLGKSFPNAQINDDFIFMPLQGSTQWDSLSHFGYRDALYNGFWVGNVENVGGAHKLSIHHMKDRLTGRGVLLDLPRHQGVERLVPGHPITIDELDACAQAQGVEVRTGDILLVRTGHLPWYYTLTDKMEFWNAGSPGLSIGTAEWVYSHEIAALAIDNVAAEVEPFEEGYDVPFPVHARLIRDIGLTVGEVFWLEELALACAEENRWEFFLCAAPLNVTNGSGSPLNPIAYF